MGEEYKVRLFPEDTEINGKYVGKADRKHVFVNNDRERGKGFVLVDDYWMVEGDKVITNNEFSSCPIMYTQKPLKSELVKLLKESGEID